MSRNNLPVHPNRVPLPLATAPVHTQQALPAHREKSQNAVQGNRMPSAAIPPFMQKVYQPNPSAKSDPPRPVHPVRAPTEQPGPGRTEGKQPAPSNGVQPPQKQLFLRMIRFFKQLKHSSVNQQAVPARTRPARRQAPVQAISSFSVPPGKPPAETQRAEPPRSVQVPQPPTQARHGYREQLWQIVARLWTRHQYMAKQGQLIVSRVSIDNSRKMPHGAQPPSNSMGYTAAALRQHEFHRFNGLKPLPTRPPPFIAGANIRQNPPATPKAFSSVPMLQPPLQTRPAAPQPEIIDLDPEVIVIEPTEAAAAEAGAAAVVLKAGVETVIELQDEPLIVPEEENVTRMPDLPPLSRMRCTDTFYDRNEPEMYPVKVARAARVLQYEICAQGTMVPCQWGSAPGCSDHRPFEVLMASLWSTPLDEIEKNAKVEQDEAADTDAIADDDAVDLKIWDGDQQARLDPMFWWGLDEDDDEARRAPAEDDIDSNPADLTLFMSQSPCHQCRKHRLVQAPADQAVGDTPGGNLELWVCNICRELNQSKLQKEQERLLSGTYQAKQISATIADFDKVEGITIATTRNQSSFLGAMAKNNDLLIGRLSNKRSIRSIKSVPLPSLKNATSQQHPGDPSSIPCEKEPPGPIYAVDNTPASAKYSMADYEDDDPQLGGFRMRTKRQRRACNDSWNNNWKNDGFNPTVCSVCRKGGEILNCASCGGWKHKQCWEMSVSMQLREEEVWWCDHCKKASKYNGKVIAGGEDPSIGLADKTPLAGGLVPAGFRTFQRRGQKNMIRRDHAHSSRLLTDKAAITEHVGIIVTLGTNKGDAEMAPTDSKAADSSNPKWYYGQCPSKSKMIMMLGKASCMKMQKCPEQSDLGFSELQRCWDCAAIFKTNAALHLHVASGCRDWSNSILFRT